MKVERFKAYEKFLSYFGVIAQVLAVVWKLLIKNNALKGSVFEHLLWVCMLIKQYTGDRSLSKAAGVDRKTFQKWAWKMISTISWLEGDVVSVQVKLVCVYLFSSYGTLRLSVPANNKEALAAFRVLS